MKQNQFAYILIHESISIKQNISMLTFIIIFMKPQTLNQKLSMQHFHIVVNSLSFQLRIRLLHQFMIALMSKTQFISKFIIKHTRLNHVNFTFKNYKTTIVALFKHLNELKGP